MRSRLALQQTASFTVLLLLLASAAYAISIGYVLRDFDDRVSDRSAGVRSLMRVRDNSASWLNAQAEYNRPGGHVHVNAVQENGAALIVISDTGNGIPSTNLPHIFDRWYRSKNAKMLGVQGSGLGLYFVKLAVEAHCGLIEVESVEGQGSSFRLLLPGTRVASGDEYCLNTPSIVG